MNNVIFYPDNTTDNKVVISSDFNKHVSEEYAPKRKENGTFYSKARGGKPMDKFSSWYYKLGEYAACLFLHEKFNLPFVKPDTQIYKHSEKSWNPDLVWKNVSFLDNHHDKLRFHVKSASIRSIQSGYPESFMFNVANKFGTGGKDHLFDEGSINDYCVFVHVPYFKIVEGELAFYIRGIIPWNFIKKHQIFESPIAYVLRDTKVCVYTKTLARIIQEQSLITT